MSEGNERPRRSGAARPADDEGGRGEARRTERLSPDGDEWSQREPVNPGWRSERAATGSRAGRRGRGGLPTSPQEFQLWLQAGGWRYIAGIAVLVIVLLIALLAYGRNDQRTAGIGVDEQKAPTSFAGVESALTPIVRPTTTVAPTSPPASKFFTVINTGELGLNLRIEHNASANIVSFYKDGTRLEQIGNDFTGPDRVWRNVRAPDGKEGWVAAEFLAAAP